MKEHREQIRWTQYKLRRKDNRGMGLFPKILENISVYERFYEFVDGIFDYTHVVYFISVIVFFLFLTVQSLEKRRYN